MTTNEGQNPGEINPSRPGTFESIGRKIDSLPEVRAAEEAVRRAQNSLRDAKIDYRAIRDNAKEKLEGARETLEGLRGKDMHELVDDALDFVKKNPAQGILISLAAGFFVARFLRR